MSFRVLKKLQGGDKDLEPQKDDIESDDKLSDDEYDLEVARTISKHLNPFDMLNQQSPSESEVKEDDNETEHASTAANLPSVPASKKKKKKRKKKSTKNTGNHISSEDNELTDKYISDIDSFFGKVYDATNQNGKLPNPSVSTTPRSGVDKSLLLVELKNLNPQNEMRRTFGKRVVKNENKRGRQKLILKSTYIVSFKDGWPPVTKNIMTMKPIAAPDHISGTSIFQVNSPLATGQSQWFAFEHSQYYQSIQNMFLSAVERTDSDFLVNLIKQCPYHVGSLIQLSELCKMGENYSSASELIERAVLILESSMHPSFSLVSGNCRLDYRRQENRPFFIVLFKHAQYLEARACCRTAFELSKLILSLNPDVDPLAMVLIIDYYAIRSKQFTWFIKFYEEWEQVRNLSQLPNMAYSYALALFCVHGEFEKSDEALQYALLMFPGVLRPLLDELSVQTDQRIRSSSYFISDVSGSQSPALHQLVSLYICRAKVIWRQNNVLRWLERNVNTVLDRIDHKDEILVDYSEKRAVRYIIPPRPILRHVILSDYKESVPLAAFIVMEKDPIVVHDPLPPLDSINSYERKSSSSSPTTAANRSVSMFFQSLLPNFNINNPGGANREAEVGAAPIAENEVDEVNRHLQALNRNLGNVDVADGGNDAGASYRELTQSLTHVVDAMRDFLQNFRITEPVPNAAVEENGSSEEDTSDYD